MSKLKALIKETKTHKVIYLVLLVIIILDILLRVCKHPELLHFDVD